MKNIIDNPENDKYKKIKKDNQVIRENIYELWNSEELLKDLAFVYQQDAHQYIYNSNNTLILERGLLFV